MQLKLLHQAQISILRTIRRAESTRYSEMMQPTGMESAGFKFHLRKLIKSSLIERDAVGRYRLTAIGKEFANNLDRQTGMPQKQPKLSVAMVVQQGNQYLFQQRLRNPFWGYWGFLSGPIRWGMEPETVAESELKKQTGLKASFSVKAFLRKRDYSTEGGLLEDKQFIIVAARAKGELDNSWDGGLNQWMTLEELKGQNRYFQDTVEILNMLQEGIEYKSISSQVEPERY
jgi:ADP-ribose pyrophosphatase YjhB (NUDIX family)